MNVSGRYHRGVDLYPEDQMWAALYLALSPETALAELVRYVMPDMLPTLNNFRLSRLRLRLDDVLDLREPDLLQVAADDLYSDDDHGLTRVLGRAAFDSGAEAILIPSATRLGDNLILFPDNVLSSSRIQVIDYRQAVHIARTDHLTGQEGIVISDYDRGPEGYFDRCYWRVGRQ